MQKSKEFDHLNSLLNGFKNIHLRCFGIDDNFANTILSKLSPFADEYHKNGPDLCSICNNKIIGIEHFGYDTSSQNKSGSRERHEMEHIYKTFQEKAKLAFQNDEKGFSKSYKLNTNGNINTLKQNFLKGFAKHSEKIDSYRKNIKDAHNINDPEIWFLAEDTSIMGPIFYNEYSIDNQPEHPLLPIFYEDIQDKILSTRITGIIFVSTFPTSRYVAFIKNDKKAFENFKKHYLFKDNTPIQFFNDLSYECISFPVTEIQE